MPYSRRPANCWRAVLLLIGIQLSACGSGGQSSAVPTSQSSVIDSQSLNAGVSVQESATRQLTVAASDGGYVLNDDTSLICSIQFPRCSTDVDTGSIERLYAISRFGYAFSGWATSTIPTLDISVDINTKVTADFRQVPTNNAMNAGIANGACENTGAPEFRALHLGDSLTVGTLYGDDTRFYAAEPASIAFYENKTSAHITAPLVIPRFGYLIAGPRNGELSQALPADHFWKQSVAENNASVDQFNAVVVALGSNDAVDIINGLDPDFVIEQRVKPLLQWLGNKPVYWILPHYARWPAAMNNIHFRSTREGLDCQCNGTGHTGTQCNIVDEMQACGVDQDLQRQTNKTFLAIYELRQRLIALQDEYQNLIVVDAGQTIAAASNDANDLYTTISPVDTIHPSMQGSEWYAWLHAWLAMHGDTGCALPPLSKWQMPANEIAMAAQLESAPQ